MAWIEQRDGKRGGEKGGGGKRERESQITAPSLIHSCPPSFFSTERMNIKEKREGGGNGSKGIAFYSYYLGDRLKKRERKKGEKRGGEGARLSQDSSSWFFLGGGREGKEKRRRKERKKDDASLASRAPSTNLLFTVPGGKGIGRREKRGKKRGKGENNAN